MMPTFPPLPLSTVRRVSPQYGWKVGRSGSAFPHVVQVKPAPGMPCTSCRFASALRALRGLILCPALCQDDGLGVAPPFEELAPLPQRSSLRSGLYCPSPSTLIRPHPSHSQAHPDFTAVRFIRDAFAVLVRLGDPRLVPCFRCAFLIDMPPSTTPGSPSAACAQFFANGIGLRRHLTRLGAPIYPIIRFRWENHFGASLVRSLLRPVDLLASLADLTELYPANGDFYTRAFNGSVTLHVVRHNYGGN
jgi:hypothetical protein